MRINDDPDNKIVPESRGASFDTSTATCPYCNGTAFNQRPKRSARCTTLNNLSGGFQMQLPWYHIREAVTMDNGPPGKICPGNSRRMPRLTKAQVAELAHRLVRGRSRAAPSAAPPRRSPTADNRTRGRNRVDAALPRMIARNLFDRIVRIERGTRPQLYHDFALYDRRGERVAHLQVRYETHFGAQFLVIKQIEFSESFRNRRVWSELSDALIARGIPVMIQAILNEQWFAALRKSGRWIPIGPGGRANSASRDRVIDVQSYDRYGSR